MSRQVDIKALVSHIVRGDGSDRCRICMGDTSEGQVHLEDTVMMDGDKAVTLAELLEVITGVEVENTAPLPNNICHRCSQDITSLLPFVKLCKESAKRWNDISNFLNTLTPSNKAKNVYIEIGSDIKTYIDTTKCTTSKIVTRKDALRCFNYSIRRHMTSRNRSVNNKRLSKTTKMSCPECSASFLSIFKFNGHIGNFRKKKCIHCAKIFDFSTYIKHCETHKLAFHYCPICEDSFERLPAFELHKLKHKKGSHECLECHQTFASSADLIKHLNKHTPAVCECGKKFPNRICFNYHIKTCVHHKKVESVFICDHCQASYNNKNCLRSHIQFRHMSGWKFQCDKCGKKMSSYCHLIEHNNIHEKKNDRYVCPCGAKYSTRRGFQKHMKKHTPEERNMAENAEKIEISVVLEYG